jgi:protein-S-isoprenylcysteine O-methyltransferase Ste14
MNQEIELKPKGHHGRPDLVGEHKIGDLGQIILLIVFFVVWILDSFILKFSVPPYGKYIPFYIRIIVAIVVLVIAWIIARKGLKIIFGEVREKPTLMKDGIFSRVRHPVYLGAILLYLGFIISTLSVASFIVWIGIIIFYFFISKYEEKVLIREFGDDYRQYMKEVPMLCPRLFRKKN